MTCKYMIECRAWGIIFVTKDIPILINIELWKWDQHISIKYNVSFMNSIETSENVI